MDQDTRMRQCKSLSVRTGRQEKRSHRCTLSDADRRHIVFDELHRIVDGHSGSDRAARRIYVEVDILFRVFGLKEKKLGYDQIRDLVIDRCSNKNNTVFEQTRIDVEGPFAPRRLLHNHRYKCHRIEFWFLPEKTSIYEVKS